ncbi:MAG: hypothetical protein KIS78_24280 [Labilithrix sp.]|nr:hypothetical protein [Labilithrix sp.]
MELQGSESIVEEAGARARYGSSWRERFALGLPCLLFVLGVASLGDWIIDDAGISFAYARNIAHLDGFVSQPGRTPVEGYSNFTWVMLLVPTFWLHVFHPVIVPKLLGVLQVFVAFYVLQRALFRRTGALWPGVVLTSLLAVSPPIVVWTASGLENGTLFLLVTALFAVLADRPSRWEIKAGVLAALLAMTRPDGLVYVVAGGLALVSDALERPRDPRALARSTARYVGSFAAVFGPFFALRLAVFGLPWPHTYYAKRVYATAGERLDALWEPGALFAKLSSFATGLAGPLGGPLLLATAVMVIVLAARKQLGRVLAVAVLLQVLAICAFVWLDEDWMGEHRFATAAVLTSFLTAVLATHALFGARPRRAIVGWAVVAGLALYGFAPRLVAFAANPTTPYSDVVSHARRFNRYAELLGVRGGSILTPDLGGELMESTLTVYDAAGLCEPAIVQLLKNNSPVWSYDHPLFYDWVIEKSKPTFVSTSGFFTNVTTLEKDPRFARDYVAINRYPDSYVATVYRRNVHSGDYVRRDALGDPDALARLRQVPPAPRVDPWIVRAGESLGLARFHPSADYATLIVAAHAAWKSRDTNRAVTLFRRALDRPGDRPSALQALAEALDYANRPDEGRQAWSELLTAAVEADDFERAGRATLRLEAPPLPEDGAAMNRGLHALYKQNAPNEAIVAFREILERSPAHYGAHYQLAVALDLAGHRDGATKIWRRTAALAKAYGDQAALDAARARLATPPP